MDQDITAHVLQLEQKLLHTDWQQTPDLLESLLAPEFEEIGSYGECSSRAEVLDWLLNKNPSEQWLLDNFRIKRLSNILVLAIYHAKKKTTQNINSNGSIRSSIWRQDENHWTLVFHQATKKAPLD